MQIYVRIIKMIYMFQLEQKCKLVQVELYILAQHSVLKLVGQWRGVLLAVHT